MPAFNLTNPTARDDPYEYRAVVKVWSTDRDTVETVHLYYNDDELNERDALDWQRSLSMEYVDFEAVGAKVEDTFTYVDDGWGGEPRYN